MQTYSHYIITAVLNRKLQTRSANPAGPDETDRSQAMPALQSRAFLWGAIAPDIPLIALTILLLIGDLAGWRLVDSDGLSVESNVAYLFRYLFFQDLWVQTLHNVFHAPLLILVYIGMGYLLWTKGRKLGAWLFWFGLSCALHTALDIPLHYDDGPLLLFPFNRELRFYSPISYWDPSRYGVQFAIFEHVLVLGMLVYLLLDWRRRRRKAVPK